MKRTQRPVPMPLEGRRRWGHAQENHIIDPYKQIRKLSEPCVCRQCGAVYHSGRWQWTPRPSGAHEGLCQACHRINDHFPAGVVTLRGTLVPPNRAEICRIARRQEEIENHDHPLNRIINIEDEADAIVINTTDIHLPRRIGQAIKRAFHGELEQHFDEGGYFVRVNWRRDA